ncbi:vanadium-dependent haloperoxidase [Lacihabitans soyangensis]|uniref:vanadium-dependent haloperoxidase n=1 Tax=Lacihabitans soyangensis TaxID=869394 RepID=UPI0020CB6E42|nr:vanadium-dependent haloperoxidase [Lacihabitans soyangensis]
MQQKIVKILSLLILFLTFQSGHSQKKVPQLNHEVASRWFDLQLKLIPQTPGFTPPVVSRALGYTGLTLYESLVHGSPDYKSLVGVLQEFEKLPLPDKNQVYDWQIVANNAQALIVQELYAANHKENKPKILELRDALNAKFKDNENTYKASVKYGEEIAKAIFKYSKTDGGHHAEKNNFPKDFKSSPGSCMWTPVGNQMALQPYWGTNRTFIKGNADFELPVPPRCEIGNSSLMFSQALEVYSVGKNLNEEQKEIALFWSDDAGKTFTPPGHGISIALQLIKKENFDLAKTAETLCRLGIAVNDAFVSCWKCKFRYNILRPISFINTAIDPNWKPLLDTPPFPEYTSGHGTVSGATAAVLSDMFGYNYRFTDFSHAERGLKPRSFDTFFEFAQEAALSRLYGGIHYRMSNEEGLKNGKRIGRSACELKLKMKQS